MTNLTTLYKLTSTGAVQFWSISVSHEADASYLVTRYGQLDTSSPQETRDPIRQGKNAGRANATTREQQAELEATAKWEKQKKKGYVESVEDAKAGKVDALIEGGILPMLAHKFAEQGHKIVFPCFIQPKLNGIRCISIIEPGNVTLWSRTRHPIRCLPHINEALAQHFPDQSLVLDGELYNHELKEDFEKIVSLVRQDEPDPRCDLVEYHLYDIADPTMDFAGRLKMLNSFDFIPTSPLVQTPTHHVTDETEIFPRFRDFRNMGYEGAMLRNATARYVNKRSYDLQKLKEFDDDEFDVIGIEEGRGRLVGHVGAFVCRMSDGKTFKAKMEGDISRLRDYYENPTLWQGKKLTVRYQSFTKAGVPLFPVGVTMRDYE
jgi:DNA ligase 1